MSYDNSGSFLTCKKGTKKVHGFRTGKKMVDTLYVKQIYQQLKYIF
jgi:hypothetical protein